MKIPWFPIIGAIAAVAIVKAIGHYFGRGASLVALGLLMACWGGTHFFYKRKIRQLHVELSALDEPRRAEVLEQLTPEIRADLERLALENKNA